jgi:acyl-CoA thioesterase-2
MRTTAPRLRERRTVRELLELVEVGEGEFVGVSTRAGRQHIFGGQLIGQAVVAASRTVAEGRLAHSMHAYFVRAGDSAQDIRYHVEKIRDGRAFSVRSVSAFQGARLLFMLNASFHELAPGLEHVSPPLVGFPDPDAFEHFAHEREDEIGHRYLLETKRVPPELDPRGERAGQAIWVRALAATGGPSVTDRASIALTTDLALLEPVLLGHGITFGHPGLRAASLDHAVWWFEDASLDEWLLLLQESPWAGHGRGLLRGSVHTRDGSLVAVVQQEGVLQLTPSALALLQVPGRNRN